MLLDATTFKTVLTPEAALGIIQKELVRRGWKQFDISDVKMVYTPYWMFSFDVLAGESSPTGKTALNAYSGELNDYVPYILDRALKKTKETEAGIEADVLPTAIAKNELNAVAAAKIAAHAGIQKDSVTISAATKYYIPSYLVWVDVAGDSFKIDIDVLLGNPQGLDAIPEKPKGWNGAAGETIEKMKKPAGWLELISKAFGMVAGAAKGGAPGGEGGMKQNLIPIVLVLLVAVAAYFYFARGSSQGSVTCDLLPQYYRPAEWFGFGAKPVKPMLQADSSLRVEGTCSFTNPGTEDISSIIALVKVNANGIAIGQNTSSVALFAPTGRTSTLKDFEIVWPGSTRQKYLFSYCRLEQCR